MRRRTFSLSLSLSLTLVVASAAAGPAQAGSTRAQEKAEQARIVKYWTPRRMAQATPRGFVRTAGGFVPAARGGNKPDKPGGGGGSSDGSVTGAPWTAGGPALTGTGKVFFTMAGSNYVCSGATADDGGRTGYSLVLTAGHCAYDETNGAFATNWMFVPEYDSNPTNSCAATVHGCFTAVALVVHQGYASAGAFNGQAIRHDWAFAVVGAGSKGGQLDARVPDFPVAFSAPEVERYAFGYPAQGKYDGRDLVYCAGPVIEDGGMSNATWGLKCDMTPGSSGGPWMRDFDAQAGSGTLDSVNSYKYNGGKQKNYMFGPKFGAKTRAVYDVARSATLDTTVSS
jgi:V8-like Glu-specific endopeptidase